MEEVMTEQERPEPKQRCNACGGKLSWVGRATWMMWCERCVDAICEQFPKTLLANIGGNNEPPR